jgi:TolB protein
LVVVLMGDAALIVNPDTGAMRRIKLPDPTLQLFCLSWSPDAKRLACGSFSDDASRNGIYTIRTSDGRGLTRITSNPVGLDFIGDWSPDGERLVFMRMDTTRPKGANQAIFVVNVDGSGLRRISPWGSGGSSGLLTYVLAGWSPDGSTILFSENGSLFTVHADGTGLTKIVLGGFNTSFACSSACALDPGWSPDGTKMVFAMFTEAQGAVNIYTANADGSDVYQVTHETSQDFHDGSPDWGPHPLAT